MPGMGGMAPPPSPSPMNGMAPPSTMGGMDNEMAMTHMTFTWSKNGYILFSGWPGTRTGMYALALIIIFVVSIIVEGLSCRLVKKGPKNVAAGLIQTVLHGLKVGLGFLVMLAVMSFNVGVLMAAVIGHTLGFFLFHSRVFKASDTANCNDGLPSSC
ncbi:Copper transporter 6 [Morella rubra]|nr:Copper transporter 6 [Morella rubra]